MDNVLAIEGEVAEVHYSRANFTKPYVLTMANERKGVRNLRTSFAVSQYFLGTVADSPLGFQEGFCLRMCCAGEKPGKTANPMPIMAFAWFLAAGLGLKLRTTVLLLDF